MKLAAYSVLSKMCFIGFVFPFISQAQLIYFSIHFFCFIIFYCFLLLLTLQFISF